MSDGTHDLGKLNAILRGSRTDRLCGLCSLPPRDNNRGGVFCGAGWYHNDCHSKIHEKNEAITAQLTAARADLEAKDKAISDATDWLTDANVEIIDLKAEVERQSVLLGRAGEALIDLLDRLFDTRGDGMPDEWFETDDEVIAARAVLSELQLKGK